MMAKRTNKVKKGLIATWEENVQSYFHIIHIKCGLSFSFVYVWFLFIHLSFLMDLGIHAECTLQKAKKKKKNHIH